MAKIDIIFNDIEYAVEESSFAEAAAKLQNHLSTTMNGSGSVITFGGISYNIDSEKLSNYTDDFVSHLGEIAGSDSKVMVNGVEYFIDSAKVQDAVAGLETVLGNLNSGSEMPPEEPVDKYSWEAVFASIDAGTYATDYAIGDMIPLDLGSEGVINMQIAAFDTDDLADGSGKAPITWIAKELLNTMRRMNPKADVNSTTLIEGTDTYGGWEKCEMRAYLKETIKPLIPETVRNRIKEVTKKQNAYDTSNKEYMQTTTEDVWIPKYYRELVKTANESGALYQSLFPDNASLKKSKPGGTYIAWAARDANTMYSFYAVGTDGSYSRPYAHIARGICLCFCT
jgi:hypothetical protein